MVQVRNRIDGLSMMAFSCIVACRNIWVVVVWPHPHISRVFGPTRVVAGVGRAGVGLPGVGCGGARGKSAVKLGGGAQLIGAGAESEGGGGRVLVVGEQDALGDV